MGLRYVNDEGPGIRRKRRGAGFYYVDPQGRPVEDGAALARVRALVIPPAWAEVWICPRPDGHIQATGRDARGRKQYRYHPDFLAVRNQTKYSRMRAFGRQLPRIRRRTAADLRRAGMCRERVLAAVVRLMAETFMRVGNDEYARQNGSYGLTTIRSRHVRVRGATARFQFRGKHGIVQQTEISDARLVGIIRRCQDLPGQELFKYVDDAGTIRDVGSEDVNTYIREITGQNFTAKDFRTWAGTRCMALALATLDPPRSPTEAKKRIAAAVREVAAQLHNRPATCQKYYIHRAVPAAYTAGALPAMLCAAAQRNGQSSAAAIEHALLRLLARQERFTGPPGVKRR